MAITVHPIRPDLLSQMTRFVQVAGVTFTIHVNKEQGKWLAWHGDTGCWGYAAAVDDALTAIAVMLESEREWWCDGAGRDLYLHGRMYERRAAIQKAFGG